MKIPNESKAAFLANMTSSSPFRSYLNKKLNLKIRMRFGKVETDICGAVQF